MKALLAIVGLTLRAALRSRLIAGLAFVLALLNLGLPALLLGDGTPGGRLHVLLLYNLAFSALILGLATLWAACATLSQDIAHHHIDLVGVKPIPRSLLWLGRWLGLTVLNALLLALVGLFTGLQAARLVRQPPAPPADVTLADAFAGHRILETGPATTPVVALPGSTSIWVFALPADPLPAGVCHYRLRYRLSPNYGDTNPVSGIWQFTDAAGTLLSRQVTTQHVTALRTLTVPAHLPVQSPLTAAFINDPAGMSCTALFSLKQPPQLQIPTLSWAANLSRALLILLLHLALLAAVGLAIGTLFTLPVAVFVSTALLVAALLSQWVVAAAGSPRHTEAGDPASPPALTEQAALRVARMIAPALQYGPLSRLTAGIALDNAFVARAGGTLLLYSAAFAAVGIIALKRRELVAPGR